jgi:phospholipid/cholesterol/gamma-HCH transport system substrate-binding protein
MFDMKKQLMWSKLKVGLVISLALLLLFVTVFFAGGIKGLFTPEVQIKAQIRDVRGLREGSPVWYSGVEIGKVEKIELNPEYGTLVTMSIDRNAASLIKEDVKATILTLGLLGDKYVELSNGSPEAGPIKPGDMIKGAPQIDLQDIVNASAKSIQKITEVLDKFTGFLKSFETNKGTVAKFFTDPSVYNNLKDSTHAISRILRDFNESKGTIKMLVKDPSLYNKMSRAASSMEEFGEKVNNGQGTLMKLAEDPSLYQNLNTASKQLSSILEKINAGEGAAGSLIRDKELTNDMKETLTELKSSVSEFRDLMKDIREHPKKYLKFSIF